MGNSDPWIPRLVVCFLGVGVLATIAAATVITYTRGDIPAVIASLGQSCAVTLGIVAVAIYGKPSGSWQPGPETLAPPTNVKGHGQP